jgi:glutamine amidotransferase
MISIIDYGMGNLKSVYKAFEYIGMEAEITSDKKNLLKSDAVILPGVGAFGDAMKNLNNLDLVNTIKEVIDNKVPFLGICLGMQLLFKSSEESPEIDGIGVFDDKFLFFPKEEMKDLKVPHMGWNALKMKSDVPLFEGIKQESFVYFVHSFYLKGSCEYVSATTEYGLSVGASVWKDNVFATQFHPEKSGDIGITMLKNFVKRI